MHAFSLDFDLSTFELTIDGNLEYMGYATDNLLLDGNNTLGITYVIGFDSFATSRNKINEPSSCSNRLASSFEDGSLSFNDYWNYSEYPYLPNNIGEENDFLAYPKPTDFWTLSIGESQCTPIHYHGVFSWSDLTNCRGPKGRHLVEIDDNGAEITLSGLFSAFLFIFNSIQYIND